MDRLLVYCILFTNLVVAVRYLMKTNCEIPFFLAFLNLMVEYRLISLQLGYGRWVDFDYGIALKFNFELAHQVEYLILIGSSVFMYCFIFYYKVPKLLFNDSNKYLQRFVLSKRTHILIGLVIFTIFQIAFAKSISQNSGFFARLGNCSFIILLFLITIYTESKNRMAKICFFLLFVLIGYITYSPNLRFQFLGWMIPVGYYLTSNIKASKKVFILFAGIILIMFVFSLARTLRYQQFGDVPATEIFSTSLDRMLIADDVNFIDGFIMMYQIYPQYLDYDYGMEHVDIILRPIPRWLWSGKPLAGWFQNYAAKYGTVQTTIGFSPTIWGVFYAEMGLFGVIFFSVIWAYALARLYSYLKSFQSNLSVFLIGVMLASMVPIFRSGDLAGDTLVVALSFWPLFVFVWSYKKFVRKELKIQREKYLLLTQ